ncbi:MULTISPECIES: ADP-ribosyltransferase-containing protein [Cupriavidus]
MNSVEFAPEFRDWFAQSRIVNDDGQPMVVHHFTYFEFEVFDRLWGTKYFGRDPEGTDTVGLWFTDNAQARYVAPGQGRRMDVYLSIQRPFYIDDVQQGDAYDQLRALVTQAGGSTALRAQLKAQGYDGIVLNGTQLDGVRQNALVAFEPEQIRAVDKLREAALAIAPLVTPSREAVVQAVGQKYAEAAGTIDGRTVGEDVANAHAVSATLDDYEMLPGVREIPMAAFDQLGPLSFHSTQERERTEQLAEAIKASGRIDPLIVIEDELGPYVLEGGHRFDALRLLGASAFPAKVALDMPGMLASGVHPLCIDNDPALRETGQSIGDAVAPDFKTWYAGSQLVDAHGAPLVIFHGTDRAIEGFAPSESGNMGAGYYVTTSAFAAGVFADRATHLRGGNGANIVPLYVKAERMLNLDILGPGDLERLRATIPRKPEGLRAFGFEYEPRDTRFIQPDLDKVHQSLDRAQFDPMQLSSVFFATPRQIEILRRIYEAAGYDAVGQTSGAFRTKGEFFEIVVFDPDRLRFAIEANIEGNAPSPAAVPHMYYGTVGAKEGDAALLESFGIQLGPYDRERGTFAARFGEAARVALQEFPNDVRVDVSAVRTVAEVSAFNPDQPRAEWLAERRAFLQWGIGAKRHGWSDTNPRELAKIEAALQADVALVSTSQQDVRCDSSTPDSAISS